MVVFVRVEERVVFGLLAMMSSGPVARRWTGSCPRSRQTWLAISMMSRTGEMVESKGSMPQLRGSGGRTTRSASVTCPTRPATVATRDSTRHRVLPLPPRHLRARPARQLSCLYSFILDMGKNSPKRRQSIAVLGHGRAKGTTHRRRAYSIAPGERLSPSQKARRLLVSRVFM